MTSNARFLAQVSYKLKSTYLAPDFDTSLHVNDAHGNNKKFYYILWDYVPDTDPSVLKWAGKKIAKIALEKKAEVILGLADSGIALASCASMFSGLPFGFVRKSPKNYGLGRMIEGEFKKQSRVIIVDNFVFSGNSLARAIDVVSRDNLNVIAAISVDNFNTIKKVPELASLDFSSLVNNSDKNDELVSLGYFPKKLVPFVQKFVHSPELFFEPSKTHDEFVKELRNHSKLSYVKMDTDSYQKKQYLLSRYLPNWLKDHK